MTKETLEIIKIILCYLGVILVVPLFMTGIVLAMALANKLGL